MEPVSPFRLTALYTAICVALSAQVREGFQGKPIEEFISTRFSTKGGAFYSRKLFRTVAPAPTHHRLDRRLFVEWLCNPAS